MRLRNSQAILLANSDLCLSPQGSRDYFTSFIDFFIASSLLHQPLHRKLPLISKRPISKPKEQQMKRITKIMLLALGLVLLVGLAGVMPWFRPLAAFQPTVQAANRHVFTLDLAVDCRTAVTEFNRGATFIINGKLFPAGTLPSGAATNDPTEPVNGVAPIGDWLVRGQHALPLPVLPDDIAQRYSSAPGDFGTTYFILDEGRTALIIETYAFLEGQGVVQLAFSAVTGGIGRFRGASGDITGGPPLGTNATGCPNSRLTFNFVTVFVPRASND